MNVGDDGVVGGGAPSASLDRLRAGLASPSALAALVAGRRTPGMSSRASVLALLWVDVPRAQAGARHWTGGPRAEHDVLSDLRLVAIEKASHLRRHAGQIAFPGGRIEADETPVAAALREASEEVGVEPIGVDVLGELPAASVMASGFDVHTVVGWWRRPVALSPVDTGEVAAVHQLAVADLVDPANRATWVHPSGHSGPVFLIGDLFIWGLTGHLISGLLDLAGWAEGWDASRRLEIPQRFFRGRH